VAEARVASLRLILGLAVTVLCILELQGLVQTLRGQSRLRERIVAGQRAGLAGVRAQVAAVLERERPEASEWELRRAIPRELAAEIELFDASGTLLLAHPRRAPVSHWLTPEEVLALSGSEVVVRSPVVGAEARTLTYAPFRVEGRLLILRLASPVADIADDLRERRQLLVSHAISLVVLAVLAGFVLSPFRERRTGAAGRALEAYEEAMQRLRQHGEVQSQLHEAERGRMEEALQDSEAMARAGELTSGIVHEVRNGLGTILGYARLIERSLIPADARQATESIVEECRTLESISNRFVDFVKRETLSLARFDLGRTLARVVARELRAESGVQSSLAVPDEGVSVTADEELLERALENVVRNAREAAGEGGRVHVSAERQAEDVIVRVEDDGPGLSQELQAGLRPFKSTKAGGLGLGLPIAQKIVDLHRGTLRLLPRQPRGLAVVVRLPLGGPSAGVGVTGGNASALDPAGSDQAQ
jgi:signal transduction histidine kinase